MFFPFIFHTCSRCLWKIYVMFYTACVYIYYIKSKARAKLKTHTFILVPHSFHLIITEQRVSEKKDKKQTEKLFEKKNNLCISFFFSLSKIHKIQLCWVGPVCCEAIHMITTIYLSFLSIEFVCVCVYGFSFVCLRVLLSGNRKKNGEKWKSLA